MLAQNASKNWLIFVDTNIYLDFYRQPGEAAGRQLQALERHKESLIISEQVWMEFLKNRQRVITEGLKLLNKPTNSSVPSILTDFQGAKMLRKNVADASINYNKMKKKVESILRNPSNNDPVYKLVSRIFRSDTNLNLKRPSKERYEIRNLARKRFVLGYPPRKKDDTSIGDAINWEWIIRCAERSNDHHHVLIVSRDGDYGINYDGESILNDWLKREFKSRISQRRTIELTSKLTLALKRLNEVVKKEDVEAEEGVIKSWGEGEVENGN